LEEEEGVVLLAPLEVDCTVWNGWPMVPTLPLLFKADEEEEEEEDGLEDIPSPIPIPIPAPFS
jgi:hypothetical protein